MMQQLKLSAGLAGSLVAILVLAAAFVTTTSARAVEVQTITSPGGIKAWLVEDHTIPLVTTDRGSAIKSARFWGRSVSSSSRSV